MHRILCIPVLLTLAFTAGCSLFREPPPEDEPVPGPAPSVIEPELERREVVRPAVDTEDWEIGAVAGVLSVEDFGAQPLYGLRLAFHATEDLWLEGRYVRSWVSDASFRRLGAPIFEEEEEDLSAWDLFVGFQVLPGEVFLGTRWARTSGVYLGFGAGNVEYAGENRVGFALAFGLKVLPTDWLSLRLEARDNVWESDLLGENEWKQNFEINLGIGAFF
ncbi:MAG: outer membrane beta-barrel domain-containing protein [Gammaproteobacteria bacterium]